jgi:8-oxo-dGTP pyrophosphatase MutT (NUDIX family)
MIHNNSFNNSQNNSHNKRKDIQCINCGIFGHTSKYCNCPTTSYGVICYKMSDRRPMYLMIQRKDSLSYVEFIRGNYNIQNKNYIIRMLEMMTKDEIDFLRRNTFDAIWNALWVDNKHTSSYYKNMKDKFTTIKNGYFIKTKTDTISFSLNIGINKCRSFLKEQEWEFPKGRRKLGEKDFQCAIREFNEESNIKIADVYFGDSSKYFEEIYLSTNKIRYRNVYYISKYMRPCDQKILFDKRNALQSKEVRDVQWFPYAIVSSKLNGRNIEKIETFKLVNDVVCKKFENIE